MYAKVKHIKWAWSRDGKTKRYYHRITGEKLGSDPAKARAKAMHINALLAQEVERKEAGIGSIADLITMYKASPSYTSLSEKSRKDYVRYLDYLQAEFGMDDAKDMDREFVLALKEKFADTPRKADLLAAVLSRICAFAIDRPKRFGLLINPAMRTGRMSKPAGHKPWPPALVENFRATGGDLWRVVEFILNTGQRVGDAIKADWTDVQGAGLHVKQSKTGAALWIPFSAEFASSLSAYPVRGEAILAPDYSKRWLQSTLTRVIHEQVLAFGFEGFSMHGLRYNAAENLAAAGCSPHEIASVTGHKTLAMVQKYTAKGDQKRLASAAVKRLTDSRK